MVSDRSLISLSDQLKPLLKHANISFDFIMDFIYKLRNLGFRNVSERLRHCRLLHSTLLQSPLLHSAGVSRETLQNKTF